MNSQANVGNKYTSARLYLTVESNGTKYYYFIKTMNFGFKNSQAYQNWIDQKSIVDRLILTPSNWFRYDNGRYVYGEDVPVVIRKPNIDSSGAGDGGEYIYHGPVNVLFRATTKSDEILYINNEPVDVLNNEFNFNLTDLIKKETNEDGSVTETRTNKYEIKISKFKQVNGDNTDEILTFTKTITIQSYVGDNWISYFAWNPDFNVEQKRLIEQYLWDPSTGEPLKDENGNDIPNPDYNPEIDPETGTIKQLVWVNKSSNNEISFIPDPIGINGELNYDRETGIVNSNNIGFIAEAVVIPKGITISDPDSMFINSNLKYAQLATVSTVGNQNIINYDDNEAITNWKSLNYGNDNTYFSTAGIYIFADSAFENMSCVKVVGYGTSNSAYKKFIDEYQNPNEYGWSDFWSTYQGKHLIAYLKQVKGFDESIVKSLNYQEVIYYWKDYVSNVIEGNFDFSNNNGSTEFIDIFKNFPNEINLFNSSITNASVGEIKKLIEDEVILAFNENCDQNFIYNQDWTINYPSNEELIKLTNMEYENINPNPFTTTINLVVLKDELVGNKVISVKNTGSKKPSIPNNDLSNIQVKDYEYAFDSSLELKEQFVKDLSFDLLNDYNLVYGEFVEIKNLEQKLKSLFYSIGTHSVNLILVPLDPGISGTKTIKLTNTTTRTEEIDLSHIMVDNLNIQLTNKNDIYKAIKNHLDSQLGQYSFYLDGYLDIYYQDDNENIYNWDSDEFLRMLVDKNPPAWVISKEMTIIGNIDSLIGNINFSITNISSDEPFDPDKDTSWNPGANNNKNNSSANTASIIGSVLGSLGIIGAIIATIFGLKIYYKNSSKKIK